MRAFARLLDDLAFAPDRNAKQVHLAAYFSTTPAPDRGWALAVLTGDLALPKITSARLRGLAEDRLDPVLFRLSHDFVGDLAETVALIWPERCPTEPGLRLGEAVAMLAGSGSVEAGSRLADLCDRIGAPERLALIRLLSGGLPGGVSPALLRTALAEVAGHRTGRTVERLEELWACFGPPYAELFRWLDGGPAPDVDAALAFRPLMRADQLDEARLEAMAAADFLAEWKWDGVRVQATVAGGKRRLYARGGDDISATFPDILETMSWQGTVDGELLVVRDGVAAPFGDLQRRLGRKRIDVKILTECPAHLRLFDLLHDGDHDLRNEPLTARRTALEEWFSRHRPARATLSPEIPFEDWESLRALRAVRGAGRKGLMLKRRDAPYTGGRSTGQWFAWQRAPLVANCVLVYARRGQGARSSWFSDLSFAAWRDGSEGPELVPVGKAQLSETHEGLVELDAWVRANTTDRFGPVRAVAPEIVLEISFDAVERSRRHKSGIVLRAPRVRRIHWDMPAIEADRLATIIAMIAGEAAG